MRDAGRRRPTPPWRPWRRATNPSRSRSLRIFRTTTGLVWRLFAIASEVVPSSLAQATKLMMWTALAIRLFVAINISVLVTFKDVKLGRCVRRSQAVDQKPRKVGNCGFNKDRFRYVAEERDLREQFRFMALRDISRQRNILVASGGEADIGYRAPIADSD